jgi:hypothetical protein
MASGAWSADYASVRGNEDGVFFFQDIDGQKPWKSGAVGPIPPTNPT